MKRKHLDITALAIAVCLSLVEGASADRYFPNNATISETIPTSDDIIVGYANLLDMSRGLTARARLLPLLPTEILTVAVPSTATPSKLMAVELGEFLMP